MNTFGELSGVQSRERVPEEEGKFFRIAGSGSGQTTGVMCNVHMYVPTSHIVHAENTCSMKGIYSII